MPKIVLKKDSEILQIFRLEAKNLRVGSDRLADVKIDDWTVGKEEAVIWPKGHVFFIKPAGAFPQLVVNGTEVTGERPLSDGDEIAVGPYTLVFSRLPEELEGIAVEPLPPPAAAPPPSPPEPVTSKSAFPPDLEVPASRIQEAHPAPPAPKESAPPPRPVRRDAAAEKTMIASMPERTKISEVFDTPGTTGEFYLLAVWGPLAGRRFPLKPGETKIGRDKEANEIVVREDEQGELDTSVSRRHASFFWSNVFVPGSGSSADFSLIDVGSKLGVMVNGRKIKPEKGVALKPGDEIGILSEKIPTIFRLAPGDRLDFAPPRAGKTPQKNLLFAQKFVWIIGGIIILLMLLVWIIFK